MTRREFLVSVAIVMALPGTALAAQNEADVAKRLIRDGFRITLRKRTWLGRIRFQARKGQVVREVVLDPSSGEILRDYSEDMVQQVSGRDRRGNDSAGPSRDRGSSGGGESPDGGESDGGGEQDGGKEPEGGGEPGGTEEPRDKDRVKR